MRACCAVLGVHVAYMAAFCAFAVDGLYVALIAQQGNGMGGRVAFVAGSLASAGLAIAVAQDAGRLADGVAAGWAVATLFIWMILGAASIGILVAPAAIFAMIALSRLRAPSFAVAAGAALALLTAAAGLVWTAA
ncbi:MAG TPA: hypothetical protein VFU30_03175 [Gaiellaceae bacterium]|nr:hypothetical protein [Gaiellaceae bacterium]